MNQKQGANRGLSGYASALSHRDGEAPPGIGAGAECAGGAAMAGPITDDGVFEASSLDAPQSPRPAGCATGTGTAIYGRIRQWPKKTCRDSRRDFRLAIDPRARQPSRFAARRRQYFS
jgi:hypothetical protein